HYQSVSKKDYLDLRGIEHMATNHGVGHNRPKKGRIFPSGGRKIMIGLVDPKLWNLMEGGIPSLVDLLEFKVKKVHVATALALATLDSHNQVSIADSGGIKAMLRLLDSPSSVQEYVTYILYYLADNE
ncbi:unnamed protein product, partial [Sphenostylis stenocarpa]